MQGTLKRVVRQRVGRLPVWDFRLKLLRVGSTLRLRIRERQEVQRARAMLARLPEARVATVIPTYRRPDDLIDAISSALAQTVTDQVVIVVDDGGGLPPSLPSDPRLVAFSVSRNLGTVGVTRNVGIRVSRSKYLAFLDDDNVWTPDHLEVSLAAHERGAELTYTSLRRVDEKGELIDVSSIPFDRTYARDYAFADASAIVVRRRRRVIFSRTPRRRGDFPREDWEFVYRLSRRLRTEHVAVPTVVYRMHRGSHFSVWGDADAEASTVIAGAGSTGDAGGDDRSGR